MSVVIRAISWSMNTDIPLNQAKPWGFSGRWWISRRTLPPSAGIGGTDSIVGWAEVAWPPQFQRKSKKEEGEPTKLELLCLTKMRLCVMSICVHCWAWVCGGVFPVLLAVGLYITFKFSVFPHLSFPLYGSLFICQQCLDLLSAIRPLLTFTEDDVGLVPAQTIPPHMLCLSSLTLKLCFTWGCSQHLNLPASFLYFKSIINWGIIRTMSYTLKRKCCLEKVQIHVETKRMMSQNPVCSWIYLRNSNVYEYSIESFHLFWFFTLIYVLYLCLSSVRPILVWVDGPGDSI